MTALPDINVADRRVVVVGGANVDIVGVPDAPLRARDSNPGRVRVSSGGVGRNIAENLTRLGVPTSLVTAFGDDANSQFLIEDCRRVGIDIGDSVRVPGESGSLYLAMLDEHHDMALALNDMHVLEHLTLDALRARADVFAAADLVVIDTNLPAEALGWFAEHCPTPLALDPISAAKAPRAVSLLPRLAVLHCNELEAGALLGRDVSSDDEARAAAADLVAAGVERAFVTLGPRGVVAADAERVVVLEPVALEVVNASGAGDSFTAGVAFSQLAGFDLLDAAEFGRALAHVTAACETTVSPDVTQAAIATLMEELR